MLLKKPRVSVIIRSFNEEKHVGNLLESLFDQTHRDFETILVDSGSSDLTLKIAAGYPVKILHIKPEDFTFGRSLNSGLRAASGEIAVLASAHVVPLDNEWLESLIAPLNDKKVALAYGNQRGGPSSKFSEAQHFKRWFSSQSDLNQASPYCNNANLALRLDLWSQHAFDESLTGLEDLAWSSYWKQQGYKIAYVAEAAVTHLHDETSAQILNRHRREAVALRLILPKSQFTLKDFLSQFARSVGRDLIAAFHQRKFLREAYGIIKFRFLQYSGTYFGYHDVQVPSELQMHTFYYPPGSLEKKRQASEPNKQMNKIRKFINI